MSVNCMTVHGLTGIADTVKGTVRIAGCQETYPDEGGHKAIYFPGFLRLFWTVLDIAGSSFGAQGRNRTTDTCIFSAVLYQLSYLGPFDPPGVRAGGRFERRRYKGSILRCPAARHSAGRMRRARPAALRRREHIVSEIRPPL
jgi:hypothetical protein